MVLQDEDYVNFRPGGTHVKKTIEPEHAEKDQQENKKYGKWNTVRKLVTNASQHINTSQMLRLSSIFSVLAQHHKSVITAGDILLVMRALGDALTEAELQDLIFELDVDRDGKLDFSELCAFVVERIYKKKLDHDFEELFRLLDQDGDGALSKDDLRNILRYFELDFSDEIINGIVKEITGSENNFITYSDLLKFIIDSGKDFTITEILNNPL
uniref:Calmodulin n=1 Tax=Schistosoma mansoni TaxID=6183 RepID=A0A5K4FEN0_SCHMA